ncbi:AsnC family transcriptional regulator [Desulfofalx alkaliphila]|uniref:siroheme decarboxylase subunit alpha n=1 Tax=Desulfofalx alkaliphila TaxID=105483 RepID=UPI0004E16F22|nr:AsnC family transcriptional regulator [Desulfofalx alkaliphila]
MKLDAIDRKLLNMAQSNFPIVARPYKELGHRLGISEEQVIERLQRLKDEDYIRRLGGIFDSRKLGYKGTLCGIKVPAHRIDEVAAVVNSYPGITHNYLREGEYNMWFTVLANSPDKVKKILEEISEKTGITDILNLPSERVFKVLVNFELDEV